MKLALSLGPLWCIACVAAAPVSERPEPPQPREVGALSEPLPVVTGSPGAARARAPHAFGGRSWDELRAARPRAASLAAHPAARVDATLLPRLHLEEATLREALELLERSIGVDVHLDPAAEEQVSGEPLTIDVPRPLAARSALDLVTELAGDEITWTLRYGLVFVTTREKARGAPKTTIYDVADLVRGIPNHPGREMDVSPSGGIAYPDEDLVERTPPVVDESWLVELIRGTIDPESWDRPGNSITIRDGKLIVTHD